MPKTSRGGGKTLTYLLAGVIALAVSGAWEAQAATPIYYMGGTGSESKPINFLLKDYWTTSTTYVGGAIPKYPGDKNNKDTYDMNFGFANGANNTAYVFSSKGGTETKKCAILMNFHTGQFIFMSGNFECGSKFSLGVTASETSTVIKKAGVWTLDDEAHVGNSGSGTLIQDGGSISVGKALYVGYSGKGTLTINDGTIEVASGSQTFPGWNPGSSGTINLNGGVLKTQRVAQYKGSGTINFNGGTLQANASHTDFIKAGMTVTVGENGGIIDNGGFAVTIPAGISGSGAMTFKGGNTTTLGGAVDWTGGTTIEAGTTVKVDTAAKKNALLEKKLKFIPTRVGKYTLISITGGDKFSDDDVKKVTVDVAPGYGADAAFSISEDGGSLCVTVNSLYSIAEDDSGKKFIISPVDQSIRSLALFSTLPTLPDGAAYYVTLEETREEFGKGEMKVTDVAEGVNVRVVRPDGTIVEVPSSAGVATLKESPQISGVATAFDATYTNTVEYAYRAPGWNASSGQDVKPPTYNNNKNDKTTGMFIWHHPWVGDVAAKMHALGDFTLVVVGTMSPSHNTQFLHIGASDEQNNGLLITTTENEDEVLIAKNTGSSVNVAGGVKASIPNAASACHAYVIRRKGNVFEVLVDGVKRGQFDAGDGFVLGSTNYCGVQVGSDIMGKIKVAGIYKAVPQNNSETGVVNIIRLFDYSISDAQAEEIFAEYPYVSQGGLYTRTVAADGAFSEAGTWEKDGEDGVFAVPAGTMVDGVSYNPSATLDVDAASEIEVNADVVLDTLTVGGSEALVFTRASGHTVTVAGSAIINSPVTAQYGALNISGAPVELGSSGSIRFDMSGFDISGIYVTTRIQLTGLIERNDERISYIAPSDDPERTTSIVYNESAKCYDFVVTMKRHYVVADGKHDSLVLTEDTTILGAGGFRVEKTLEIPGKLTFDPVKTPIYIAGELSFGEGAKFALASAYSGMTLGRVVLLTYKEGKAALPDKLNDLFYASSIASADYAVTSEDAPDSTDGRKQLVLTVGDYVNKAKEIRILPVGDSITQGVGDAGYEPQYRSTIAALLAANGYKPKFFGVWKRANYDAAHVRLPEDWAWHSGISAERIMTGGNCGGVEDNMHVYLDIAGDVNVITFLIGTNDIGSGKTGEETYAAYTNLMFWTAAQRPNAKIIGATILDRDDNVAAKPEIAAFNTKLREDYAAKLLPANFVMLDLYGEVPLAVQGNFLSDRLHLNWKGCVASGEAFAGAIMAALPLAGEGAISGESDPTVTDEPQTALGAANILELADYRSGMTQVFTIDAAASNCFKTSPYTTVNDSSALSRPVSKAGYYMELVRKGTNRRRYVWVDFDATGKTLGDIDFPWEGADLDFVAKELHVYSNDPYIHNVAVDDHSVIGAVEGTWRDYTGIGDNDGVPTDVVAEGYGWNDTLSTSDSYGYGCFQIHRILSGSEAEVLFAWNKWGGARANSVDEIGIGSFGKSEVLGSVFSMDYTFTSQASDGAADMLTANAYSVRRVEIWAKLEGEVRHGVWSGLGATSDFDNPSNWEDGIVPSAGKDIDFSAVPPGVTIAVMGASSGRKFGTARMGANPVTFTGNIAFAAITDTSKIAVAKDSTVTLDGDLEFGTNVESHVCGYVFEGGKFVVTGKIIATPEQTKNLYPCENAPGWISAKGLVNNAAGDKFYLVQADNWQANWMIGEDGISGAYRYTVGALGKGNATIKATADFAVSSIIIQRHNLVLVPDGHVITLGKSVAANAGGIISGGDNGLTTVTGPGKVVVNYNVTNLTEHAVSYPNAFTVTDGGTLAIVPSANPSVSTDNNGTLTVNSGATLEVAESGTVTLGCSLALANDAALGFNYTTRNAPVLDLTGKTVSFDEGETTNVVVKVSAKVGVWPKGGANVLTSGGKFADATVLLADGVPGWAKGVSVIDGEIVLDVKPAGTMIIVR